MKTKIDCYNCGGDGYSLEGGKCPACNGTGKFEKKQMDSFLIMVSEPQVGPKGGKLKPAINQYVVTAESREEALSIFRGEMGNDIPANAEISVANCQSRVMRTY